jgi:hypothetical protein
MSRRIIHIQNAVSAELARHGPALEIDTTIQKIHLTVFLDRGSGMPAKISYTAISDRRLTSAAGEMTMPSIKVDGGRFP